MTLQLNELEAEILRRIARDTPSLVDALAFLKVTRRDLTGAGSYTYFQSEVPVQVPDGFLTLSDLIVLPGIPDGMGAALAVSSGHPEFLEIFTYGIASWDGSFSSFTIS